MKFRCLGWTVMGMNVPSALGLFAFATTLGIDRDFVEGSGELPWYGSFLIWDLPNWTRGIRNVSSQKKSYSMYTCYCCLLLWYYMCLLPLNDASRLNLDKSMHPPQSLHQLSHTLHTSLRFPNFT